MISKESIKYSINSLKKRKSRSFLTILSIFVGITTIFIFLSFGLGLYSYVNEFTTGSSADKVTVLPGGSGIPGVDDTFVLTDDDIISIERTQGVYDVEGAKWKTTEVYQTGTRKFVFIMGYDPEKALVMEVSTLEVEEGRWLRGKDTGKVILGYNYKFDDKILPEALELGDTIRVNEKDLTVVGFMNELGNPQDDSQIYVTNDYFSELFPDSEGYGMIVVRVDIDNIDQTVENIEKSLRKSRGLEEGKEDFTVSSFEDLLESYSSTLNIIVGFIILIALISVLVSAINTANTMITSVIERIREIGVMKSIGAKNSEIFNMFLFESSLLGFVSGALGVLVGVIFTSIAGNILSNLGWSFLKPFYSFGLFAGCILFATVTGAVSGVFPAINAAKTNPVEALRYE